MFKRLCAIGSLFLLSSAGSVQALSYAEFADRMERDIKAILVSAGYPQDAELVAGLLAENEYRDPDRLKIILAKSHEYCQDYKKGELTMQEYNSQTMKRYGELRERAIVDNNLVGSLSRRRQAVAISVGSIYTGMLVVCPQIIKQ